MLDSGRRNPSNPTLPSARIRVRVGLAVGGLGAATGLGVLSFKYEVIPRIAIGVLIALVCLAFATMVSSRHFGSWAESKQPTRMVGVPPRLALCWVAVAGATDIRFGASRDATAVTTGASGSNVIQIAIWGLCGCYALHVVHRQPIGGRSRAIVPMVALVGWLALSSVWSAYPPLTAVRTGQFVVLVLLFLATRRLHPVDVSDVLRLQARYFMILLAVLVAIAFAEGSYRERFTWLGTHPGMASAFLALGVLLTLYGLSAESQSPHLRYAAVAVLIVILALTRTRGTFAADRKSTRLNSSHG